VADVLHDQTGKHALFLRTDSDRHAQVWLQQAAGKQLRAEGRRARVVRHDGEAEEGGTAGGLGRKAGERQHL
jgi:hypothetical protein